MDKQVQIVINRSEVTAGTRGASLGPDAILTVSRQKIDPIISGLSKIEIPNENKALDEVSSSQFCRHFDAYKVVFGHLQNCIQQVVLSGNRPFVLAGDHGSAAATVLGLRKAFPDKRLGVVWIDAHADLHSPLTTPSGNIHGMPLSLVIGDINESCAVNQLETESLNKWKGLVDEFNGFNVAPSDLVFIALRDFEQPEAELIRKHQIKLFTVDEVRKFGAKNTIDRTLSYLASCDMLYVSFDVDSMDPMESSFGTGTPVEDGLTVSEAHDLMVGLAACGKVVCAEMVEVNPCLDNKTNRMAEIAFSLTKSFISSWKKDV